MRIIPRSQSLKISRKRANLAMSSAVVIFLATIMIMPTSVAAGATSVNGPLHAAGDLTTGESFTLFLLKTCRVFDGLTIVKNTGTVPLRITAVNVVIPSQSVPSKDQVTYQLRSYRAGSTTGAVGAVANMPTLGGTIVGGAVGSTVRPITTSSLWYIVVFRMKVLQARNTEWVVRGLRVSYKVGAKTYHAMFPQTVRFPPTDC